MKAHWWSCVLGLLCIPAEVALSFSLVSQEPPSISLMRVNSSAEITCSTSLTGAQGFTLYRYFNGNRQIVYLYLVNGTVAKTTIAAEFKRRLHVSPVQISDGQGFTLQFSLLGEKDLDVYFCSWSYITPITYSGKGTIIILREKDPKEQCKNHILKHILIVSSITAFTVILVSIIGALIVRCNRFKAYFRPARVEIPARPTRPQPVSPQQTFQHYPYLTTQLCSMEHRGLL
ncbi:uncharacterized protein LOC132955659 [Labrus mixtus]|uniref:uncharacterized protein LOC132955659 n=1 Tax=Labrus mixtus TaxID=508554 RepID=UPI0029C06DAF|nr:uncharacterized protein LOC132955659 [Labrus mixtus]